MENKKSITSVEKIFDELHSKALWSNKMEKIFELAKEMEQNQIIIAYTQGCIDTLKDKMKTGEQYHNGMFNL